MNTYSVVWFDKNETSWSKSSADNVQLERVRNLSFHWFRSPRRRTTSSTLQVTLTLNFVEIKINKKTYIDRVPYFSYFTKTTFSHLMQILQIFFIPRHHDTIMFTAFYITNKFDIVTPLSYTDHMSQDIISFFSHTCRCIIINKSQFHFWISILFTQDLVVIS